MQVCINIGIWFVGIHEFKSRVNFWNTHGFIY
jgi:hypothetical protein